MFGTIWRDTKKSVKSVTVNTNKIVYQVLNEPEELKDDQVVVILKQRNPEKRIYEQSIELVFDAGRIPSVEELTEAVKNRIGAADLIKIIKYVNYDFEWV
jgi:ubiquitin carboxyl-terminal hydrolase 40